MQPKQDLAGGQTLSSGVVGQQGPNYIYSIQGRVTRSFMAAFQPIARIKVFKEHKISLNLKWWICLQASDFT